MIMPVCCSYCHEAISIPLGQASASIKLSLHHWCDHCRSGNDKEKNFHFCSPAHLILFVTNQSDQLTVGEYD